MRKTKLYRILIIIFFICFVASIAGIFAIANNMEAAANIFSAEKNPLLVLLFALALFFVLLIFIFSLLIAQAKIKVIKQENKEAERLSRLAEMSAESTQQEKEDLESDAEQELEREHKIERIILNIMDGVQEEATPGKYAEHLLSNIAREYEVVQGIFFFKKPNEDTFKTVAKYAYYSEEEIKDFKIGEGISGQVAKNQEVLNINNVPEDYITILSGLGSSSPEHLLIIPFIYNKQTVAVMELASFVEFVDEDSEIIFKKIAQIVSDDLMKIVGENVE